MPTTASRQTLVDLETKFWQAMDDENIGAAIGLLTEPATIASAHGALKFDRAMYRKMPEQGRWWSLYSSLATCRWSFPRQDSHADLPREAGRGTTVGKRGKNAEQEMHDSSTWIHTQMGAGSA